ncbi:hypothetical protein JQ604_35940 [Bradyrhizobium jicamae]|uniref:hypothetical protein n=1 Tax=Bradyrhizobium jicamae TaxID=280332 RepID=UPI001BAB20E4|nr:hypothetical protein [Bradyrhizobium jicamae]MBR0757601.1 hypothetical protein [Bradyrhizobium jicamae]
MDPEIISLCVQRPGEDKLHIQVALTELDANICRLAVTWPVGSEERHFDATDFYECLRAFRRVIEPEGFRVLCQGARPNVYPSAMARGGGAWKSYALRFGEPGTRDQLVDTFDPVEDIDAVGTVAEQEDWLSRHWAEFRARAGR